MSGNTKKMTRLTTNRRTQVHLLPLAWERRACQERVCRVGFTHSGQLVPVSTHGPPALATCCLHVGMLGSAPGGPFARRGRFSVFAARRAPWPHHSADVPSPRGSMCCTISFA